MFYHTIPKKNFLKHTLLALLMDLCLTSLRDAGFYPKAIVNDLGSTNAAAMRLLGVSLIFQSFKTKYILSV